MHSLPYKLHTGRSVFASFFEVHVLLRNVNNIGNQVHMTLNIHIISRITNDFDI